MQHAERVVSAKRCVKLLKKTRGTNCEICSGAGHILNRCIQKNIDVVDLGYPEVFFRINQMMVSMPGRWNFLSIF